VRGLFEEAGFAVFRVSTKRVHDAAEVYDGVASLRDAKAVSIVWRDYWLVIGRKLTKSWRWVV